MKKEHKIAFDDNIMHIATLLQRYIIPHNSFQRAGAEEDRYSIIIEVSPVHVRDERFKSALPSNYRSSQLSTNQ